MERHRSHHLSMACLQPVALAADSPLGDDPFLVTGGATDSDAAMRQGIDAIEAHRRRPVVPDRADALARVSLAAMRTSAPPSRATQHGTAAALKAEAPQNDRHPDGSICHRDDQRAARKVSNARKARRGYR